MNIWRSEVRKLMRLARIPVLIAILLRFCGNSERQESSSEEEMDASEDTIEDKS